MVDVGSRLVNFFGFPSALLLILHFIFWFDIFLGLSLASLSAFNASLANDVAACVATPLLFRVFFTHSASRGMDGELSEVMSTRAKGAFISFLAVRLYRQGVFIVSAGPNHFEIKGDFAEWAEGVLF